MGGAAPDRRDRDERLPRGGISIPGEAEAGLQGNLISLEVTESLRRSRLTVFFRWLLAFPHYLWLSGWTIAAAGAAVAQWLFMLVSGRPAAGLHRFLTSYLRYSTLPLLVDDPPALALEAEAREDDGLGDRHVLVHRRRARRGADDPADLVADRQRKLPPALAPGPDPARFPGVRVVRKPALGVHGHGSERVVDQIRGLGQDRELVAVVA